MSICFFGPNEIAQIRLKFSIVNKTENQASLRLAPKQANAVETYEVYETVNEKLSPKLAIYELIDRLKKQFPKATTELAKLEQMTQIGNQQVIQSKIKKGQTSQPKICIPTRGEIEIRREFPRELKDRTSGMMLMAGWSAWNDNDEIRTILCEGLITDYRQRDVVNELHRRI
ncbi:MAG: hypothetical protein EZS28_010945 [Streblomastix strix]|uniref:Uncharacterized protein n=1 Tax=Streblomastix strix TaxID=222440 RepID=A0A5J4WGN4_9EUKA|nr:MAG: hypothetical protein EZS28_010945 [Streblomastix strix]